MASFQIQRLPWKLLFESGFQSDKIDPFVHIYPTRQFPYHMDIVLYLHMKLALHT